MADAQRLSDRPFSTLPSAAEMRRLGGQTDIISASIQAGSRVGYVDYPMHINVGDLLIFLGAMDFFASQRNALPASYCVFDENAAARRRLEETDVIACHGGGNFGDIYTKHQRLRERVVAAFPHKPVVVMPQSLHFGSEQAMRDSAAIFRKHPDVTIYVRDEPSYDVARRHFTDKVFLCPDMAHRLFDWLAPVRERALSSPAAPQRFNLMRRDVEATPAQADEGPASADWTDIMSLPEKMRLGRFRAMTRLYGMAGVAAPSTVHHYAAAVKQVIGAIASRLSVYENWNTSRLHGAIFGLLMEKTVSLRDNSYGKNSRYFSVWGSGIGNLSF